MLYENNSSSFSSTPLLMISFMNSFIIPYNKNLVCFIEYTRDFLPKQKKFSTLLFHKFPFCDLFAHLFTNEDANGGQKSLLMTSLYETQILGILITTHGPCIHTFERNKVAELVNLDLDLYTLPFMTQFR